MEGGQGGGVGAINQAMIQSKMSGDGKGGVMALTEFIKIEGTNPSEQMLGAGLQGVGQGMGSGMGMLSGNVGELMNLKDMSGSGLPSVVGEIQELNQSLSSKGYVKIETGEPTVGIAQHGQDAIAHYGEGLHAANFQNDVYTHSAQHGHNILGAGTQQLQQCHTNEIFRPQDTPHAGQGRGGPAMG